MNNDQDEHINYTNLIDDEALNKNESQNDDNDDVASHQSEFAFNQFIKEKDANAMNVPF